MWQGVGTFTPRAHCCINEFLSALTSLFVRPHSSPVSRDTEPSHRVQGRGQGPATEDKRRTRPGHRARPREKVSRTLSGRPYKRWPEIAFWCQKHLLQATSSKDGLEWTRGGQGLDTEPSHRGQEEDKAWTSQGPSGENRALPVRPGSGAAFGAEQAQFVHL